MQRIFDGDDATCEVAKHERPITQLETYTSHSPPFQLTEIFFACLKRKIRFVRWRGNAVDDHVVIEPKLIPAAAGDATCVRPRRLEILSRKVWAIYIVPVEREVQSVVSDAGGDTGSGRPVTGRVVRSALIHSLEPHSRGLRLQVQRILKVQYELYYFAAIRAAVCVAVARRVLENASVIDGISVVVAPVLHRGAQPNLGPVVGNKLTFGVIGRGKFRVSHVCSCADARRKVG